MSPFNTAEFIDLDFPFNFHSLNFLLTLFVFKALQFFFLNFKPNQKNSYQNFLYKNYQKICSN